MDIYQERLEIEENSSDRDSLLKGYFELVPCPRRLLNENGNVLSRFFLNGGEKDRKWLDERKLRAKAFLQAEKKDFLIQGKRGKRRLFYPLRDKDRCLGVLILFEYSVPFSQISPEVLFHLSRALRKRRKSSSRFSDSSYLSLLESLLNGSIPTQEEREGRLAEEGIDSSSLRQYLRISLSSFNGHRLALFRAKLKAISPTLRYFFHEGFLLLFSSSFEDRYKEISTLLTSFSLTGRISLSLSNLFSFPSSFKKNRKLYSYLKRKEKEISLFLEKDYAFLHPILDRTNGERRQYRDEKVKDRWNYDRKNKTEFCLTLFTYLKEKGSLRKTSKTLNYHKNTIHYRLNKIKELFNLNYDDSEKKRNFLFSLCLVDYRDTMGKRKQD